MDRLLEYSAAKLETVSLSFRRFLFHRVDLRAACTGVIGQRGSGRSTLLLQLARLKGKELQPLYLDLGDPVFAHLSLFEIATRHVAYGGELLVLDELHRYPAALTDLQLIRQRYPGLRILFACSMAGNDEGLIYELSRFSELHHLPVMSFREFLAFKHGQSFPVIHLDELLDYNLSPGSEVLNRLHPLPWFDEYLVQGMYPFAHEPAAVYGERLRRNQMRVVSEDIMAVFHMDYASLAKVSRILCRIADLGPSRPHIEQLAAWSGTSRDSLLKFMKYLHQAGLLGWLAGGHEDINYLNKPERISLSNPNLACALAATEPSRESLLEMFALSQLRFRHQINQAGKRAWLIDLEHRFEWDWLSQPSAHPQAYRLTAGEERKRGGRIPLWMLGFLY